jgi:hypothetical protein
MTLFSKIIELYFSEIHFDLEEDEGMHSILSQSRIDKRTAENMEGSMKIIYKNGVAAALFWIKIGCLPFAAVACKFDPFSCAII